MKSNEIVAIEWGEGVLPFCYYIPTTITEFTVPTAGPVKLMVYNLIGHEVATLVNETLPAGTYTRMFNAADFASGVYICRLQSGGNTVILRMVLQR